MEFEAVIGLEIHIELNTTTKLFCNCANHTDSPPNTNTCPTCLWFPGAVPLLSDMAVDKAALVALGLGCELQPESSFDQKVYYYPDLAKGYQLTQAQQPIACGGYVEVTNEKGTPRKLRIHHIHLEEDVAKLIHEMEGRVKISLVDFNRAGVPLIEIVTEPDIRTPHEAMEMLKSLRNVVRSVGASECSLESGSMRADANISIRPKGTSELNTKVEVKNMNSLRSVGDAIAFEIARQTAAVNGGEAITEHTRLWDADKKVTLPMRDKFDVPYIPEPTIGTVRLTPERIAHLRTLLPELPAAKADRLVKEYSLSKVEALFLSTDADAATYFETLAGDGIAVKTAYHWLVTQLMPLLREQQFEVGDSPVMPSRLAQLLKLLTNDEINANAARETLAVMFHSTKSPAQIVEEKGFRQLSDTTLIDSLIETVLQQNQAAVADLQNGIGKAMGFLIGQVMQASDGKANPKLIKERLSQKFNK